MCSFAGPCPEGAEPVQLRGQVGQFQPSSFVCLAECCTPGELRRFWTSQPKLSGSRDFAFKKGEPYNLLLPFRLSFKPSRQRGTKQHTPKCRSDEANISYHVSWSLHHFCLFRAAFTAKRVKHFGIRIVGCFCCCTGLSLLFKVDFAH